jgi:drug/metabolite transporter (DMT)-like permease
MRTPRRPATAALPAMTALDWGQLALLSVLWGGTFFFVELLVPHLPPLTIVLLRVALAGAVLAPVLMLRGLPLPRGAGIWAALAVMAFLNNVVPFSLYAAAQGQITGGLAAILNATTPLFGVVVAHLATRDERLTRLRAAGVAVGFGGVVIMVGGAAASEAPATVAAYVACLVAAACYALSGVWGRRFGAAGLQPIPVALSQMLLASAMMLPLAAVFEQPWTLPMPPPVAWLAIIGMAVLSTALAYLLYFGLLARAGATNLLLVTFLIPASAIGLGVLVLGEVLLARHVAGLALILGGLALIDGRLPRALARRCRPAAR